jgi:Uma2 family endonuclease
MDSQITHHLFTADEYDQMITAGILTENDLVELINGEIVEMSPINVPHVTCVIRATRLFSRDLAHGAFVSVQNPIRLDEWSQPEPDIALLSLREDVYAAGLAEPEDILLLVEVADTSLHYDRAVKVPLYARAGIQDVWLVNLAGREIEVYREPTAAGYRVMTRLFPEDTAVPLAFPDVSFTVDDILGP